MGDKIISQEGYDKLKKEHELLTMVRRREIANRIQKAKDMGDLSENAEYSEAKDAQAFNEGRIAELVTMLKNLTVVENENNKNEVGMGSTVILKTADKEKTFTIVSFNEADPLTGKISNESPLGRALDGKKPGEKTIVKTPRGEIEYKIISIK